MRPSRPMAALALLALGMAAAPSQGQLLMGGLLARRLARANKDTGAPAAPPKQTIAYGNDALQNLDLFPVPGARGPVPLVVFVHGGAWSKGNKDNGTGSWKAPHYTGEGYAFASLNYRLVPEARVEDQAADIAHALARLLADADRLGIDRHRVVLMGHSAGAHLVALVGTDGHYLHDAGLNLADLAGVIPIDGAAYDVPEQMKISGAYIGARYEAAFGTDPARQRALSPVFHAEAPNAPRFLILHVQRPDGIAQARELAEALTRAGTPVQRNDFDGTGLMGHMTINRRMGDPAYAATGVVDSWLKQVFGR